jgi:gamma-glutamyltranspeptidase/glutathione hydrolase
MTPDPLAPHQGPTLARRAMVAASHPAATEAGLAVLRAGGNAIDATAAVAFLLTVLKPARCSLGGDIFLLIYSAADGRVTAINGSGVAPAGATHDAYAAGIPQRGLRAAAVPGFVDGVLTALHRFGTQPLATLLAPAIEAARDGFPTSLRLAETIGAFASLLSETPATAAAFLPGGHVPELGQLLKQPDLATTLEAIARDGRDGFYGAGFNAALLAASRESGAHFAADDLPAHRTAARKPISAAYRGLTVYEQPPVSRGHILLEELRLLDGFDLAGSAPLDPEVVHLMVEAKKLAFADAGRYAGDPDRSGFDPATLLDESFIAERRARIDRGRAATLATPGELRAAVHDTTSFCVVDEAGNAVAAIQSIFYPWGSGVVVPGTGVLMNNRLVGFTTERGHANAIEPGKRPMHTLNNYLVLRDGRPILIGCTPGGQQQVQTNLQMISAIIDGGYDVQTAADLPRWGHGDSFADGDDEDGLALEGRVPESTADALRRLGHRIERAGSWDGRMGRVTAITVDAASGVRAGASDLRGEGRAAGH